MAPPGRRRHGLSPATLLLGLVFLFSSTASAASAVLGIDLGTEYIKAVLVKPGIPLEIVLTKDSKRKEISAVTFKPSKGGPLPAGQYPERFYGSDAVALSGRFPGDVYPNLKQLLGVPSESDAVTVYTERYPALKATTMDGRSTVAFKSGVFSEEEKPFSVEELLAMELKNVKDNAKVLAGAGTEISDVVFTIPPFYTVEERRALEVAAKLAGLKVLGAVTDGLAVGLNIAMNRKDFPVVNEGGKPEVHIVFDMGAGSTSATVLKFQGRTVKDVGRRNKTVQEVQVLGTGWDRTLGGDALNTLLVKDMISSFVELPGAKSASVSADAVKTHGRAAAKLWKEAEKVRQILSANTETSAFFESFYEDVDFRYKISRSKFEELAAEFAARVEGPIKQGLETAGLSLSDVDSVIVHGGASRTPFVQSRLESLVGKGKIKANVNSDEAAVFGAAFKAAGLSPSFKVKEIRDTDTQGYNHGIQYMFNLKERDQKIFTPSTKLGATKDLPFQMMGEFEFTIYQAAPGTSGDVVRQPVLHFASGNLTRAVTKMIDTDGCDRESFNNYVQVRLSPVTGVPEVTSAWVTCETEAEEAKGGIVDGVKNFFGMGDKKDQQPLKDGESGSESTSSSSAESSSTSTSSSAGEAPTPETAKSGPKKKTIRSAVTFSVTQKGYEKHPRKEFKRMQDRLAAFDASDKSRRTREEVLNSLEAFTYRARDYLEDDSFIAASTADVRATIEEKLSAASEWIYSEGHDATEDALKAKLKELEDLVNPVLKRKDEAAKRPDAIKELESHIADVKNVVGIVKAQLEEQKSSSSKAADAVSKSSASPSSSASADPLADLEEEDMLKASASEASAEPQTTEIPTIYTDDDLKFIENTAAEASKWLEENQQRQNKLKPTDDPAFTIAELKAQTEKLNAAIMNIMMKKANFLNRKQQQKPKPKPKAKKPSKKSKKASKKGEKSEERKEPTQEELEEALKKAGLNSEGIKLKTFDHADEIQDEKGRLLTKLDLAEDATEEDIMAAIDKATKEGRERLEKEEKEKKARERDEL